MPITPVERTEVDNSKWLGNMGELLDVDVESYKSAVRLKTVVWGARQLMRRVGVSEPTYQLRVPSRRDIVTRKDRWDAHRLSLIQTRTSRIAIGEVEVGEVGEAQPVKTYARITESHIGTAKRWRALRGNFELNPADRASDTDVENAIQVIHCLGDPHTPDLIPLYKEGINLYIPLSSDCRGLDEEQYTNAHGILAKLADSAGAELQMPGLNYFTRTMSLDTNKF